MRHSGVILVFSLFLAQALANSDALDKGVAQALKNQALSALQADKDVTCGQIGPISCGQTVLGSLVLADDCPLGDGTVYDQYSFSATNGQQITVNLTSPDFDAYLFLTDAALGTLAVDDDSGSGTNARIQYTFTGSGEVFLLANSFFINEGSYTLSLHCTPASASVPVETYFVPITPCRLFDTRRASARSGRFGGGTTRDFFVYDGGLIAHQGAILNSCGIPVTATAVHLNFSAVSPAGFGYLRAWPGYSSEPTATLLVFTGGPGIANSTALAFCTTCGGSDIFIKIYGATTHLVGDAVGYYLPILTR